MIQLSQSCSCLEFNSQEGPARDHLEVKPTVASHSRRSFIAEAFGISFSARDMLENCFLLLSFVAQMFSCVRRAQEQLVTMLPMLTVAAHEEILLILCKLIILNTWTWAVGSVAGVSSIKATKQGLDVRLGLICSSIMTGCNNLSEKFVLYFFASYLKVLKVCVLHLCYLKNNDKNYHGVKIRLMNLVNSQR